MAWIRLAGSFVLAPGASIPLEAILNSGDFAKGGDYVGPVVAIAFSDKEGQRLSPSTVGLYETNWFYGKVVYTFSVRNDSADWVTFAVDVFYN
jgi:hypothetical protein